MKYGEARRLFKESTTIPYGWHYCAFHKDIESDLEPCSLSVSNGQARPLGAMKWLPIEAELLQCLLEEAHRRNRSLVEKIGTSEERQPADQELAFSAAIG